MLDVYGWTFNENGEPEKGARFIIKIPKMKKAIDKSISI
jgi:hypothetical protein